MKCFSVGALALSALVTVLLATACGSADEEESVATQDQAVTAQPCSDESNFAKHAAGIAGRVVCGEYTSVDGSPINTWAILSHAEDRILAVGVTFGMEIVKNMPKAGDGPAGAFASLRFPEVVRRTTYFNHLEIQPVPTGHMSSPLGCNTRRNSQPVGEEERSHFDFHFYSISEDDVWAIPACPSLDPACPSPLPSVPAELLPAGYSQPGGSLVEMGRHSSPSSLTRPQNDPDYCDSDRSLSPYYLGTAGSFLIADMIAGFLPDASKMHFIEPMISQERLLQPVGFELATPRPSSFGTFNGVRVVPHPMLYPLKFETRFHGDSCDRGDDCRVVMIFSDFISVQ